MNTFLQGLKPFISLGITIAIIIALFWFLTHILIWGLMIGLVFYAISRVKRFFFSKPTKPETHSGGRIIEHDEIV